MTTDTLSPSTRILVVDDDPDLLLMLAKMLARIGVTAKTAATAADCLTLLDDEHFDLLVLDLMLPDADGFDILRKVRAETRFDHMPVLILSARADSNVVEEGLELGADGYLTKPYLPNTLTSNVRALLAQRQTK